MIRRLLALFRKRRLIDADQPPKVKPIPNARFLCLHILATTSGFGGVR